MPVAENNNAARPQQNNGLTTGSVRNPKSYDPMEETQDRASVFRSVYESAQNPVDIKKTDDNETLEIWKRYKSGDANASNELLRSMDPTIDSAINSMAGGDMRFKTRARIIARDAFDSYDPKQGASLNTYVYGRLQRLKRMYADRGNFVHVPEKSALERRQLEGIKKDYELENGVEPSLSMLADMSGMPIQKVGRLMSTYGTTTESATKGESGDSLYGSSRTPYELYVDSFYEELPERDKKIYEWSTGYRGSPKLDRATMAKRLGVSEASVSVWAKKIDQRAANFSRTLNQSLNGTGGDE